MAKPLTNNCNLLKNDVYYIENGIDLQCDIYGGGFVSNLSNTQKISFRGKEFRPDAHDVLKRVREAMHEKGYDPVVQIAGYLLCGDPTYITTHNNARSLIGKLDRDELMEAIVDAYFTDRK